MLRRSATSKRSGAPTGASSRSKPAAASTAASSNPSRSSGAKPPSGRRDASSSSCPMAWRSAASMRLPTSRACKSAVSITSAIRSKISSSKPWRPPMAVYKKTYRPYDGELTTSFRRLLVIPRYAFEDLNRSRFLTIFFLASFIYPLVCALLIYVRHNASALSLLGAQGADRFISINVTFFMSLLGWQSMLALFLASFIGPGQVSPDLANNALSLYLARPFSRAEYVIGKMSVLLILLSLMTWIPGLLCFALQGYLEGGTWMQENWRFATGMFFGAWIWILILSLLALALSAWVK